jgi:hypothetical protein
VASVPDTGSSRRHRLLHVVLPCHITDSGVFRPSPWVCDGHCYGRIRRRWTNPSSRHPVIACALWGTCDTACSWGVELCDLYCSLLRDSPAPGVSTDTALSSTRQEGNIHFSGTYIRAYVPPPARLIRSVVVCGVFSGCWQHYPIVLSGHVLDLCTGLLTNHGQHVLGREQRCQQRSTRCYGPDS